ncbi:MAG: sensor histidine kinase, partial [Wenzhouxiangellaceae bacterium]
TVVNEAAGYPAGDVLLKQVAQVLSSQRRDADVLARLRGDEFGLLLTHCDIENGAAVAEKLCETVGDMLDARLEALEGSEGPTDLARHFPDDEVGQLASVVDDYARKLHELVERDKAFNADVSHELRTPLAVISGATELLLGQPDLPPRPRERLLRIARAARQSTDITTALLHLVRAERGSAGEARSQDVGQIVEQLIDNYRPLTEDGALELQVEQQAELNVIAPEAVIAVVLGNLVGNAIRYTAEGEVRIQVRRGDVRILDTGPGIAEDELPYVFDRHFRGRDSGGKGSGLGLSIVKRLCDLYGWCITFANRDDRSGLDVSVAFFPDLDRLRRER